MTLPIDAIFPDTANTGASPLISSVLWRGRTVESATYNPSLILLTGDFSIKATPPARASTADASKDLAVTAADDGLMSPLEKAEGRRLRYFSGETRKSFSPLSFRSGRQMSGEADLERESFVAKTTETAERGIGRVLAIDFEEITRAGAGCGAEAGRDYDASVIGSNEWLYKVCQSIESTLSVTYRGTFYQSLRLLGSGQINSIYSLDEDRVLRVLKVEQMHTAFGPSMHMLKNICLQAETLTKSGLSVAAIENDPLREGFIVQRRIKGPALTVLSHLEGVNALQAQVLKDFIEFGLKNKMIIDFQLSNFIIDETSGLPVLVDFYEESQGNEDKFEDDVILEQQRMLLNFLPKVCGSHKVGQFLTENLQTLNCAIYNYLKAKGLAAYLPAEG